MLSRNFIIGFIFFILTVMEVQAQSGNLYRYKDDQGNEIIATQIPAEFVKNGYEIMNDRGQVIREVSRTLSDEERANQADSLEAVRLAEEARIQQEEDDTLLLRLYRSPEEVIRRRDTTLEELDAQLTVLNALRGNAEEDVARIQITIDNNVEAEREVPQNILSQFESASEERDRLDRQITRIENERADSISTAQRNIDRLMELLNIEE
jgi:hypothetical protein